jgi:general stress protein 26
MAENPVEKLRDLVKDIKVAMMTTRRADGHLVSRPMATQEDAPGADFWFVALRDSEKVQELRGDPHLNLAFYKDRTHEYVSVSGTAVLTDDRELIHRLWQPDWKLWMGDEGGDEGGAHDGSKDDPRLFLIGVHAESAHFLNVDKPQVLVLFEMLKGAVTGKAPEMGEEVAVSGPQIRRDRLA